jgi:hypothetical protein
VQGTSAALAMWKRGARVLARLRFLGLASAAATSIRIDSAQRSRCAATVAMSAGVAEDELARPLRTQCLKPSEAPAQAIRPQARA